MLSSFPSSYQLSKIGEIKIADKNLAVKGAVKQILANNIAGIIERVTGGMNLGPDDRIVDVAPRT